MVIKTCIAHNCKIRPTYNNIDETIAIYCATHKKDGMIDVISKRCIEIGCYIQPVYNYKNETKPIYCKQHKKDDMIDVKNKKCSEEGCNKQPTYNYEYQSKAAFCASHKKENMINIKGKCCIVENCHIRPSFNYEDEIIPIYCKLHKKDGMKNIMVKLQCIEIGCSIIPSFNYSNEINALYCNTHKKDGMINIKHAPCKFSHCNKRPSYNYENETIPIYCAEHKKENMINITHTKCKTQLCNTIISNRAYEGYCTRCFIHLFPDRPNARNYKTKEIAVDDFIKSEFQDKTIITDRRIQDGCSKRRPDIVIDLGIQVIIIEIDENQHIDYDCSCENKRIMELSQDVGHRPIIFIRFNPDDYLNKDCNNITSCWGINKNGITCIKKTKINEWNERLCILKEHVQYWMCNESNKTVEIIQLFYDQNIIVN